MSKITLTYEKKDYVLEYNRQSVKMMEGQGFVADEISTKPMTMIPMLFYGAFLKNCKGVKRNLVNDMYDAVGDKTGLVGALLEMYVETVSTLTDDTDEGNATWTLTK